MSGDRLTIAVTGANGFVGANLVLRLMEQGHDVRPITRDMPARDVRDDLAAAEAVFHLAAANRCDREADFWSSNRDYTASIARAVIDGGRKPLVVYSSTVKALEDTPYGRSKLAGEQVLLALGASGRAIVSIWRLPNLCGKWSRPDYNSAVATFCHNIARELPIRIDDPGSPLSLLYVDDLIHQWLCLLADSPQVSGYAEPQLVHDTTVGEVADLIRGFHDGRSCGIVADVGSGLARILYPSYVAALPVTEASYSLAAHTDARGNFVEVLKTRSSGQFSYFSTHPGMRRGGHYHHSKVEKFLVAHGTARFRFRNARSGEYFELVSSANEPLMIEAIPGWAHEVINIGDDELVVLTWANEPFDPERPDTHPLPL